MLKKNLFGIVMVILLIATFGAGYLIGKGSNQAPAGETATGPGKQAPVAQTEKTPETEVAKADKPQPAAEAALQKTATETPVETAAPAATPAPAGRTFYGTAAPVDEANVQSKQGGTITLLSAEEGDSVRKGETIVRFDDSEVQLQLQQNISSRGASQQQVKEAESNFNTVQTNVARNEQLFEDGMISQQQMDDINNQLESARAALNSAREGVTQAEAQIAITKNSLKNFQVAAPISGLIETEEYHLGEVYQAGSVIYHVIDIDRIYVEVEVPETYIKQLREGMQVAVAFDALGEQAFSGAIDTILPTGTADNRNFTIKVLVANPDHAIKPGMFARVEIILKDSSSTL